MVKTFIKKKTRNNIHSSDSDPFAELSAIGLKWVWFIGMLAGIDSILSQEGYPLRRFLIGGVMIAGVAVVIIYHLHKWGVLRRVANLSE